MAPDRGDQEHELEEYRTGLCSAAGLRFGLGIAQSGSSRAGIGESPKQNIEACRVFHALLDKRILGCAGELLFLGRGLTRCLGVFLALLHKRTLGCASELLVSGRGSASHILCHHGSGQRQGQNGYELFERVFLSMVVSAKRQRILSRENRAEGRDEWRGLWADADRVASWEWRLCKGG
jgi:hypothetical protein